jgi:hypothetical protein
MVEVGHGKETLIFLLASILCRMGFDSEAG